jgi:CRP-like cAMP-binding protein
VTFATTSPPPVFIKIVEMPRLILRDFSIFKGFSEPQIDWLAGLFEQVVYHHNDLIFDQGDPADYLYVLATGNVIIRYKPYDGPALTVATIDPGCIFGWSAVLGRPAYTSFALALEDSEAYRLSSCRLRSICDDYPEVGALLVKQLADMVNQRHPQTQNEILHILRISIDQNDNCDQRKKTND